MVDPNKVTYFAETDSRNTRIPFGIKSKDRLKHVYVIGKTGMGKSTLLENMAVQDIKSGEGMAFIDPHGKTADLLLEYIPEERKKDVVYFAPFDIEYPISFNIMEDVGADKRHLVANGLMSVFKKIWVDAWSGRMEYILNNTILALLEYPGSTLLSINRMLSDKDYRKLVVANISDPSVRSFWVDEFANYTEKFAAEATPAIQNKIGQFSSNPLIRNIIGQPKSSFDIRKIMDEGKIIIVNLSKGRVGESNANLIGSMLITKIYLAAMSRADSSEAELNKLPNFYLYVDEFQSFANESFANILSEARKYKLNLTIAHQYIEQMSEEVRAAVFGNVGTMITFRVGAYDAETLEKEFAPAFTAEDLVNLGFKQIYLKLMIDGVSSQPFSAETLPPIAKPEHSSLEEVINNSRELYAEPKLKVEAAIAAWHALGRTEPKPAAAPRREARDGREDGDRRTYDRRVAPIQSSRADYREPQAIDIRGLSSQKDNRDNFKPTTGGRDGRHEGRREDRRGDQSENNQYKEKKYIKSEIVRDFPEDDFKPLKAISLESLKKESSNQRKPSQENLSELRNVLSSLTKKAPEAKIKPEDTVVPKVEPKKKTQEIPEADLKALLGVED